MNDLPNLKTNKEGLPFPVPGNVCYQDFSEPRFQQCDSKVFIRPAFFMKADIPSDSEIIHFPCIDDSCYLLYVKKGKGQLVCDDESYYLTNGSGFLVSADHSLYLKHDEEPISCMLLIITGELLWELYKVQNETMVTFTRYQYPDFEQRINSLLKEYLKAETPLLFDFSRHMDHLLSRLIHQTIRGIYDKEKLKKYSMMQAIIYMKEHCCDQIQVGEIANDLGYSSSHFSRLFQAEFHQSPKKYIISLRIAHAEKLLETSDTSIENISMECGFNTTTHFINTFRDLNGMTPLQYRKLNRH